jgi:hypothetical protein
MYAAVLVDVLAQTMVLRPAGRVILWRRVELASRQEDSLPAAETDPPAGERSEVFLSYRFVA